MQKLLKKLIVYHQIHKMHRNGWKVSRIADFLVINRRTVSKYHSMTEHEYFDYQESIRARKRELDPYEGFVKIKLELFPQTSAAQMHDWLKEHQIHLDNYHMQPLLSYSTFDFFKFRFDRFDLFKMHMF